MAGGRGLRARRQGGFTLIELLVVVLILSVLAALAIPAYINQRTKAAAAQVESALRQMANFQQSWLYDHHGYAPTVDDLVAEGFRYSSDVVPTVTVATITGYCLEATSAKYPQVHGEFSSDLAYPVVNRDGSDPGICP